MSSLMSISRKSQNWNLWYTVTQHGLIHFAILKLKMQETPLFSKIIDATENSNVRLTVTRTDKVFIIKI